MYTILALWAFAAAALASPLNELAERGSPKSTLNLASAKAAFCSAITQLVVYASATKPATSFCSSYLAIPTVVKTGTQTSISTIIVPQTSVATNYDIRTSTDFVIAYPTHCMAAANKDKRAQLAVVAKPSCFAAYASGAALSSACSCLSIPTPTSTATVTITPRVSVISIISTATTKILTVPTTEVNFYITASAPGSTYNGGYGQLFDSKYDIGEGSAVVVFNQTSSASADLFQLDSKCQLLHSDSGKYAGFAADQDDDGLTRPVYFDRISHIADAKYIYVVCQFDSESLALSCNSNNGRGSSFLKAANDDNANEWYLEQSVAQDGEPFTPIVALS